MSNLSIHDESKAFYQHLVNSGQSVNFELICQRDGVEEVHTGDHREHDGIGFIVEKLCHYYDYYYPGFIPSMLAREKPQGLKFLKIIGKHFSQYPFFPAKFTLKNTNYRVGDTSFNSVKAKAHLSLSQSKSRMLYELARSESVQLSSLIMANFSEIIRDYHRPGKQYWMFPISLRPQLDQQSNQGNLVSYIDLVFKTQDELEDIHRKLIAGLKNGDFWGTWFATKSMKYVPQVFHPIVFKSFLLSSQRTGTFVNLGDWDRQCRYQDRMIYAHPAVYSHLPVALSFGHWSKQTVFGLSIHPRLSVDQGFARSLIDRLVVKLGL
jgi:hypothetical protein